MSAAAVWLLLACTHDPSCDVSPASTPDPDDHRVTQQAALAELDAVLAAIDEPATRGTSPRTVRSVATVKGSDFGCAATRTGEGTSVEELVYIANFDDGRGYAILGADDRLPSVLAVTECGSLTAAEFAAVARGEYDDKEVPQPFVNVAKGVRMLSDGNLPFVPPVLPPVIKTTYEEFGPWEFISRVGPFVPVKWDQEAPYNYYMKGYYMGCVAVAAAQLLTSNYYKYRRTYTPVASINGDNIDWTTIFNAIENGKITFNANEVTEESKAVSKLIFAVGKYVMTQYGPIGSSGSFSKVEYVQNLLYSIGFKHIRYTAFDADDVETHLRCFGVPIMVGAKNAAGEGAHAWLIDGFLKQKATVYTKTFLSDEILSTRITYRTLLHVNFGYNGLYDGYYYSWSFNLQKGPLEGEEFDKRGQSRDEVNYSPVSTALYHTFN